MFAAKNRKIVNATPLKRCGEGGFSLLEVLVSMLIFAFGVLGMVGLQARAVQVSYDAEDRMRASLMADEIIANMWEAGTVSVSSTVLTNWQSRVSAPTVSGLPGGSGTLSTDSNGVTWITITWQAPSRTTSSQYVTQIIVPPSS